MYVPAQFAISITLFRILLIFFFTYINIYILHIQILLFTYLLLVYYLLFIPLLFTFSTVVTYAKVSQKLTFLTS